MIHFYPGRSRKLISWTFRTSMHWENGKNWLKTDNFTLKMFFHPGYKHTKNYISIYKFLQVIMNQRVGFFHNGNSWVSCSDPIVFYGRFFSDRNSKKKCWKCLKIPLLHFRHRWVLKFKRGHTSILDDQKLQ